MTSFWHEIPRLRFTSLGMTCVVVSREREGGALRRPLFPIPYSHFSSFRPKPEGHSGEICCLLLFHPLSPPPAGETFNSPPLEGARGRKKRDATTSEKTKGENFFALTLYYVLLPLLCSQFSTFNSQFQLWFFRHWFDYGGVCTPTVSGFISS